MSGRWPSPNLLLVALIIGILLVISAAIPVRAGDNRINPPPWVNSFGAIAVYCVDASGKAGGSFAGGGVVILNNSGQQVFFASEAVLNNASAKANNTNISVIVR